LVRLSAYPTVFYGQYGHSTPKVVTSKYDCELALCPLSKKD
jgi:hypothetical protein